MTTRIWILSAAAALGVACAGPAPKTAEEKKAKGDQILREMSNNLAGVKNFSFTAEEVSEKVGPGGKKTPVTLTRHVVVRRPDGFTSRMEGGLGTTVWYDGKHATHGVRREEALGQGADAAHDGRERWTYAATVYDLKLPWADLLYSSPTMRSCRRTPPAAGWGWRQVDGRTCDHLSYQHPVVDWQIWVTQDERSAKQLQITYKQDPGQPVTRVTFKDENLAPKVDDSTFTAKVPDGYTRIRLRPPRFGPGAGRDRGRRSVARGAPPRPTPSGR